MKNTIIELKVRNHQGTMSHVIGLFSRKAILPDAIFFKQDKNNNSGKIFLLMNKNIKKDRILKHLGKLHDITEVSIHEKFFDYFKSKLYFKII